MLTRLAHLALEIKDLDAARSFYVDRFGLQAASETATELRFPVGETDLVLRRPTGVPRGGLHTHFAFSAAPGTLAAWRERLAALDPEEVDFGGYRSLYVYDPDGNCVEIGGEEGNGRGDADTPTGIFEVVLEVRDLDTAEATYTALGFEPVDRGESRRRVRLRGPMDLELWEPQLGLADARGGVHVDLGFETGDPAAAADAIAAWTTARESVADGVRVRDGDGHWVTFRG
ncbi:VOC family protein [Haloplanus aerogenes]|uniref:Catechol-2,3-dioxygenase n=1 Tax=Haloplanus aerogenes TaxID=660522 RepID=A0A3M0E130_9EURY|nr:VOC family protein [Haloplanus aerogenes]AZH25858.1 fosmidomycin resistance protein [Haloplanus aerogenes]RMB25606.1 catechol-2,3-dioxygenase [Haloplanus aerogenes]